MVLGQWIAIYKKMDLNTSYHSQTKWIIDLNVTAETKTFTEKGRRKFLCPWIRQSSDMTPIA